MSQLPVLKSSTAVIKLSDHSPYVQIGVGAGGGLVTGLVLFRVSKLLAICVGGSILCVQLAMEVGVVSIKWDRVDTRQVVDATTRAIQRDPFRTPHINGTEIVESVKNLTTRLSVAFLAGFLLGFGCA
ncbi:FUN14 domain-containing protein fndc-1 [Drosophila grimshawi]|uniref:FUN14 domain-containing protein fndc-1 n=1 Tax=Drosophila grimshawi TaxID=7222 RepID=UPI000C870FFB|nr:FUN14 domain-containing protein fndc-1 [Drosophila grimshawi]